MWLLQLLGIWEVLLIMDQDDQIAPQYREVDLLMLIQKNIFTRRISIHHAFINISKFDSMYDEDIKMMHKYIPTNLYSRFLAYAKSKFREVFIHLNGDNKTVKRTSKYLREIMGFKKSEYLRMRMTTTVLYLPIDPEMTEPLCFE